MSNARRIFITGAFALAVATQLASAAGTHASTDCKLHRIASVDFAVKDLIFVPVVVNGSRGAMVLDTGSAISTLWGDKLGHLHLRSSTTTLAEESVQTTEIHTLAIGELVFRKGTFRLGSTPSDAPPEPPIQPLIGTLGMDVFANVDFELDFARNKVNLYSQEHCPGKVVYWANAYSEAPMQRGALGNFYFPIELDGKKLPATLSTASLTTSLTTDLTKKLYGFDEHSAGIESESDGSGAPAAHYRAMMLKAAGLNVANARIKLLTSHSLCLLRTTDPRERGTSYEECIGAYPPLKLGLNVLRQLHFYLATKEKVLYFTPADAAK